MNPHIWSTQQDGVFNFLVANDGHLIVRARAGTGKTTTLVEAVKRYLAAHPGKRVIVCAFNTKIKDELVKRFAGYAVEVCTLHSLGFSIVRANWPNARVEKKDARDKRKDVLAATVCPERTPSAVLKLVAKLHTLGREIAPHAKTGADMMDLAFNFACEPDEQWVNQGWTVERVCAYAAQAMNLAAQETGVIDFSDMIFLPVRHGWMNKYADLVVVDEGQDMNTAQLEIAQGVCRGWLCLVGDDRQGIYSFRGADAGCLDRLKEELGATELGLTTTYRCGRAIVALAAELVPDFEAGADNPEGEITEIDSEELAHLAGYGDFVLSRTNAPLVATAMGLLKMGKRTKVAGRAIGDGLIALVKAIARNSRSVPDFLGRLTAWEERNVARAKAAKQDHRVEEVQDNADTLRNLSEGVKNVQEIEDRIAALFTDDGLGQDGVITCSSIHRAKGLEANRVFILRDTLRDHNIEEQNLRYVAITRAKKELVWVM